MGSTVAAERAPRLTISSTSSYVRVSSSDTIPEMSLGFSFNAAWVATVIGIRSAG